MRVFLLIAGLFLAVSAFSQDDPPAGKLTTEQKTKLWQDVDKLVPAFESKFRAKNRNQVQVEFAVDTFRIQRFIGKWITAVQTDADMSAATYGEAKLYDSLLNKYYKKLLSALKPADKPILIQTQRAWIAYRDAEEKLIGLIGQDKYSGGGTMQSLIDSAEYLDLIKKRVFSIFDYYTRVTRSE